MELFLRGPHREHSKSLLSKEWLVKTDNQTSTPYLFKFYSNTVDLSCCVLLTDTKSVWTEVLTSKQFARRWRDCNRASASIVESNFADLAFELEYETFKWRWETCFLGHKASAEVISKHLIFPLISLNHLAFSSPEAVTALSDADVEKARDFRHGRTARRSVDTHIKNALSKPRIASTLRRMTAMFNFIPDLQDELIFPDKDQASSGPSKSRLRSTPPTGSLKPQSRDSPAPRVSPLPPASKDRDSDSDSSPTRPVKKVKKSVTASLSDEDSEEERKRRVAQLKSGGAGGGKRGTRQPIKRGGKRF
ncbi:hypothetical protein FPV67DRAFT_1560501 [Lyophyllum atratum]|nr:hypothetical protein FPV67DRAFT_1560501 [Lyophyllum atratum]